MNLPPLWWYWNLDQIDFRHFWWAMLKLQVTTLYSKDTSADTYFANIWAYIKFLFDLSFQGDVFQACLSVSVWFVLNAA